MAEARKSSKPVLLPAAESSDPAIHQLLAQRQTATANGDTATAAEVVRRLAELGYE
jgi:hypothetical protein